MHTVHHTPVELPAYIIFLQERIISLIVKQHTFERESFSSLLQQPELILTQTIILLQAKRPKYQHQVIIVSVLYKPKLQNTTRPTKYVLTLLPV